MNGKLVLVESVLEPTMVNLKKEFQCWQVESLKRVRRTNGNVCHRMNASPKNSFATRSPTVWTEVTKLRCAVSWIVAILLI